MNWPVGLTTLYSRSALPHLPKFRSPSFVARSQQRCLIRSVHWLLPIAPADRALLPYASKLPKRPSIARFHSRTISFHLLPGTFDSRFSSTLHSDYMFSWGGRGLPLRKVFFTCPLILPRRVVLQKLGELLTGTPAAAAPASTGGSPDAPMEG